MAGKRTSKLFMRKTKIHFEKKKNIYIYFATFFFCPIPLPSTIYNRNTVFYVGKLIGEKHDTLMVNIEWKYNFTIMVFILIRTRVACVCMCGGEK